MLRGCGGHFVPAIYAIGGHVYHVLNRANARQPIFHKPEDYLVFERVWREATLLHPLPLLGYC